MLFLFLVIMMKWFVSLLILILVVLRFVMSWCMWLLRVSVCWYCMVIVLMVWLFVLSGWFMWVIVFILWFLSLISGLIVGVCVLGCFIGCFCSIWNLRLRMWWIILFFLKMCLLMRLRRRVWMVLFVVIFISLRFVILVVLFIVMMVIGLRVCWCWWKILMVNCVWWFGRKLCNLSVWVRKCVRLFVNLLLFEVVGFLWIILFILFI